MRCGFVEEKWCCRCKGAQCQAWVELCKAVGGRDGTPPPSIPMPDRRAAIAATKKHYAEENSP